MPMAMSGKVAKRDEMERRAAGLLDEIEELEAKRGKPSVHPNRRKPLPDPDEDIPDLSKIE
jgi:hypothetical protein